MNEAETRAEHIDRALKACAGAEQVREAVMTSINPRFAAHDYWNSYA